MLQLNSTKLCHVSSRLFNDATFVTETSSPNFCPKWPFSLKGMSLGRATLNSNIVISMNWESWKKMPNIVVAFQCEFVHCQLYVLRVKGKKTIYSARCKCCPSCSSKHANKICIMNFHKFSIIFLQNPSFHRIAVELTESQWISPDCNRFYWIAEHFTELL